MKNILFLLIIFIGVKSGFAQNISGLYSGSLINDSTKKVQNYELALSEYKDKITGYAYTTFIVNDTFYYSVKRVKGEKKNGQLIVEDVKMLVNNFPESPAKGVHQINIIPLTAQDTMTELKGTWKTTQTKKYYALSGSVDMKRDNDSAQSQLIAHLTELNVIDANTQPAIAKENKTNTNNKLHTASLPETLPYTQRQMKVIQTISVSADSLILSFYDNGVVDGDTISVYLNNQPILNHQLLTAYATKKIVHIDTIKNSTITITLVAENLGTLPPNTGLIMIEDGSQKHQVHFSADLQTNAAIVLRKEP